MQKMINKMINVLRTNRLLALVIGVGAIALIGFNFRGKETSDDALPALTSSSSQISSVSTSVAAISSTKASSKVTIDISGAVKHGGVYTLHNGARLADAIEAAGGLSQRAQIKAINRAQLLNDQDKLYIPFKGEKVANNSENPGSLSNSSSSNNSSSPNSSGKQTGEKINLNTASVSDLQKLSGVGEKRAEQIIAYREQNGGFKKIEDLMQVSGIGEKTFASLKDQLAV